MSIAKKSIISGLVWIRGSLGENQPSFQVVVNKPITLDQGEQIAMMLKHSVDQARAQIAAQKEPIVKSAEELQSQADAEDACPSHDGEHFPECESCHRADGSHANDCVYEGTP